MTTDTKVNSDPRTDVGRRLAELEERTAAARRRLAALGWTDAALDELTQEPVLLCGSAPFDTLTPAAGDLPSQRRTARAAEFFAGVARARAEVAGLKAASPDVA